MKSASITRGTKGAKGTCGRTLTPGYCSSAFYEPIRQGLEAVESEIAGRSDGRFSVLLGGKRLRPALLLLAARAWGDKVSPEVVHAAAAVEMVHAASLIHDDVVDSSTMRRSGLTLHRLIGVKPAIVFADLLFVQGLSLLEELRTPGLLHELVREVRTMCEGQWLEVKTIKSGGCTEEQYREVIEKKTASLFAFCCRCGGLLRSAPRREQAALAAFGRDFGYVYQLMDDAHDVADAPPEAIERQSLKWGGRKWLSAEAEAYAGAARKSLAGIPDRTERTGMRSMLEVALEE
jgi:geranylgeranyl pyrophosphate synthase